MAKKLKKTPKGPTAPGPTGQVAKPEAEEINPVRKKDDYRKMRRTKPLKPLSGELSNGVKKTKIRVIGIGGGGCSIISEIASQVERATFVAANTDLKALKEIPRKVERFHFGESLTQGLGTGMNPELAEICAQNDRERIKKLLENQDLSILVATLGGGVGSGATPVFAQIAKKLGLLTLGIFTLPFEFEKEKKMEIAQRALEKLKPKLNTLTIIPNEKIFQIIDKTTPLKKALSVLNKTLADSLRGLIETIYTPGLINIDFADLKTILQGQGRLAYLNTTEVTKSDEDSAKKAIEKAINSPLYPYSIRDAKGVLFNIVSQKDLSLTEVGQISKTIHALVNKKAKIIFGIGQDNKYVDRIKIILLATSCLPKNDEFEQKLKSSAPQLKPKSKPKPKPRPKTKPNLKPKTKPLKIKPLLVEVLPADREKKVSEEKEPASADSTSVATSAKD